MDKIEQSQIDQQFFKSNLPFSFNLYICETLDQIDFITPFVKQNIHSKILTEIAGFQLQKKQDDYYIYERVRSIKVGFEYFWPEYLTVDERPFVYHLLSLVPNSLYEKDIEKCDIIFHSHFGNRFENFIPGKKYVFFSGEKNYFPSYKYHLSLSNLPDSDKTVCYPFLFTVMHTYEPRYNGVMNFLTDIPIENKLFCAFIVSNPCNPIRNTFFKFVSENYKKVMSYGKCFNNVGYTTNFPYNDKRQLDLLAQHKFVICFENAKLDNYYITEKILIAKSAGTVPIYWGSKKCLELFNPNSYLYLEDETADGFMKLLKKIILVDNDPKLYLKIRNTPLFYEKTQIEYTKFNLQKKINQILFPEKIEFNEKLKNCPPFFYINMDRSKDRNNRMVELFEKVGISNYKRVEAVDGNCIMPKEPRLSIYEEATTLSHLKAIQEFYETNLESVIICEDDISFEWIDLWKKPLNQIIQEAPEDCEILQLAYTLYPVNFKYLKTEYNPFVLVTFNGAMAYYITRKAAEKILSEHTFLNPRLNEYTKIRPVSDVLIFDKAKTYTYKYCLFTYPDDNKSTIHDDHLWIHNNSKICARKIYDTL